MSNQLPHKEMIDAYLTGNLSPEDSERLMQSLEQDPALKEEFLMQQDLVHSLQDFRKQQLKARLNNIEVGSGYSFTSAAGFKMIAGATLLALLGTGAYFAYTQLELPQAEPGIQQIELTERSTIILEGDGIPQKPELSRETQEIFRLAPVESTAEAAKASVSPAETAPKAAAKPATRNTPQAGTEDQQANAATPDVVKPDVLTYFEEQDVLSSSPEVEAPEDKLADIRSFETKNIEVSTKTDKRYPFHYSFYKNQLHIYGDFSQVPYEVLEVNSGVSTNYYLYHNGKYYELNPNQQNISRLKELKNEKIISELEITRAEKLNH